MNVTTKQMRDKNQLRLLLLTFLFGWFVLSAAENFRDACDESVTVSPSGYIVSENYPSKHGSNIHCECTLQMQTRQSAQLTLEVSMSDKEILNNKLTVIAKLNM